MDWYLSAAEYRRHAETAQRLADVAEDAAMKRQLATQAANFRALAARAERAG
jgi:hypothetical protein